MHLIFGMLKYGQKISLDINNFINIKNMRKLIVLLMLFVCISVFAQQTSMTVDNQTPGWLSSKINYGDQRTIENLKVTGYIDKTDLAFIGKLIHEYSLTEVLDLTDANIVGTTTQLDDVAFQNMFSLTRSDSLRTLHLPISLKSADRCLSYLSLDSLVAGGSKMHVINKWCFRHDNDRDYNDVATHLIFREGVDSIGEYAFGYYIGSNYGTSGRYGSTKLKTVTLPTSVIYLGRSCFAYCTSLSDFVIPPYIKKIGREAFYEAGGDWKVLYFPETIEICDLSAFASERNNSHNICNDAEIYFPENIKNILSATSNYYTDGSHVDALNAGIHYTIHFKTKTPPSWSYSSEFCLRRSTLYVPKGSKATYQAKLPYKNATIIEVIPVEDLQINVEDICYVGESKTINLVVSPTNATYENVAWKVSDEDIAEIVGTDGNECTLSFKSVGEVNISAIIDNGEYSVEKTINVCEHTTSVQISEAQKSIYLNNSFTLSSTTLPLGLSDGKVTWSCSDTDIATVDENGNVKGLKQGKCTITATSVDGGYTASCEVTVMQPVAEVWLDKHELNMNMGDNSTLRVNISPSTADDKTIAWSTEDEDVATVDADGKVTAVAAGTTKIWAVSNDNNEAKDYCEVTVNQPVTGLTLDYTEYTLNDIGSTFTLTAEVQPETATNKEVTWRSSDEKVCIVSNGLVVATGYGKAIVMATTKDGGYLAMCTVEVVNATGINDYSSDTLYTIYNENGIKQSSLSKGVNIIRFGNGTTHKVFVK